jgi:DsrE/DsrF/DsrH-like protein
MKTARREVSMKTAIVINQDAMGHGDPELGQKILGTFLTKAGAAFDELEAIAFYNSGVRCLAEGSPYLPQLSTLDEQGVDLIACGTCVDAFELRDRIRVGEVGSMDRILSELERAAKVITL